MPNLPGGLETLVVFNKRDLTIFLLPKIFCDWLKVLWFQVTGNCLRFTSIGRNDYRSWIGQLATRQINGQIVGLYIAIKLISFAVKFYGSATFCIHFYRIKFI